MLTRARSRSVVMVAATALVLLLQFTAPEVLPTEGRVAASNRQSPTGRVLASSPEIYAKRYQNALKYLLAQASGPTVLPRARADAAVALAEAGMREPAQRLVTQLMAQRPRTDRALAAEIWAVSRVSLLTGHHEAWPWTTQAMARLWSELSRAPHPSVESLALAAHAMDRALLEARARGYWFFCWRWHGRMVRLMQKVRTLPISPTTMTGTDDVLAGARWQIYSRPRSMRVVAGLWHLGVVEPQMGVRRHIDPGSSGLAVDAATTYHYVLAAADSGLGELAAAVYNDALPAPTPTGGVDRVVVPRLGWRRGLAVGPVGIAATALYAMATRDLMDHGDLGIGWRRVLVQSGKRGKPRWWVGQARLDPIIPWRRGGDTVVARGLQGRAAFYALMDRIERGRAPVLFWNNPWPGLPSAPVSLASHRAKRGATEDVSRSILARRFRFCAEKLVRAVDAAYPMRWDGSMVLSERQQSMGRAPAYLWPLSQWVGARERLWHALHGRISNHQLTPLMDRLLPYFDTSSHPPGCTAAIDAPQGLQFFDDNGWVLLDDLRAYRLTGSASWLKRAAVVFRFMVSGWDTKDGGEWFNTKRQGRTESATGTFLIGAEMLYRWTGDPWYRRWASHIRRWNAHHMMQLDGLYGDTLVGSGRIRKGLPLPYDSGVMIDADIDRYRSDHQIRYLRRAESLADGVLAHYQDPLTGCLVAFNTMSPSEQDAFFAIFLESLARLQQVAGAKAYRRAIVLEAIRATSTCGKDGLYGADWSMPVSRSANDPSLLTQASVLSLLASAISVLGDRGGSGPSHDWKQLSSGLDRLRPSERPW